KDVPYLNDHKVVDRIILPAAAFLESIIAAGKEVLTPGSRTEVPFTIENFTVEAAMEIEETTGCNIQTVVSSERSEENVQYTVSINRQISANDPDKWKRHASGNFNPTIENSKLHSISITDLMS